MLKVVKGILKKEIIEYLKYEDNCLYKIYKTRIENYKKYNRAYKLFSTENYKMETDKISFYDNFFISYNYNKLQKSWNNYLKIDYFDNRYNDIFIYKTFLINEKIMEFPIFRIGTGYYNINNGSDFIKNDDDIVIQSENIDYKILFNYIDSELCEYLKLNDKLNEMAMNKEKNILKFFRGEFE